MKQLSKGQMRIIIALNIVIVVLLCGLFFLYPNVNSPVNTLPVDEDHDIYRKARFSLNPDLHFETNFGGSADEELVAAFSSPDQSKIHILGNTTSNDYDFATQIGGVFFIVTDKKGKIETVSCFGENGDILRKAILAEGGYLLAVENTVNRSTYLAHINYQGSVTKKLTHNAIADELVCDLILMENCYLFVVQSGNCSINLFDIKIYYFGLDLAEQGATVLHNASYNQEYVAVYPKGIDKFIMSVNFRSELWNGMVIYEFSKTTSQYTKVELETNYLAIDLMPIGAGYVALVIDSAGRASMITISSSGYTLKEKKYLTTAADSAKLFFANSFYYSFTKNSELANMIRFDSSLQNSENISIFNSIDYVLSSYVRGSGVMFACGGVSASVISISGSQSLVKTFGSDGEETNTKLVFLGNEMFLVCESNKKGLDIGDNFGGKDIWLTKWE